MKPWALQALGWMAAGIGALSVANGATVNTWEGTTTAWATPGNWSLGMVPNETHEVVIDGDGTAQPTVNLTGGGTTIAALTVGATAAATLTFQNGSDANKLTVTGNCTIGPQGTLTHPNNGSTETQRLFLDITGNLLIEADGKIDVDARGYQEKQPTAYGGGIDQGSPALKTAASHGGRGGRCTQAGEGESRATYGSVTNPVNIGAGGVSSSSRGGGAVILKVAGDTVHNGLITADGWHGWSHGGAAGGTVNLTAGTLSGNGTFRANGGNNSYGTARGSGGGGRIAIVVTNGADFGSVSIQARGGHQSRPGAAGTIYLRKKDDVHGTLIVDNNGKSSIRYGSARGSAGERYVPFR